MSLEPAFALVVGIIVLDQIPGMGGGRHLPGGHRRDGRARSGARQAPVPAEVG
jgi:inner membrane transporter RhtA